MKKNLIPFFAALCLFLSAVEYAIPKPLPFMRLGLANLPLLLALPLFSKKDFFILGALKVLGASLISGTLFSYIFVFSFSGTLSSVLILLLLKKLPFSLIGLSIASALSNAFAQILVSYFFLFKENTKYIVPLLLISGLATGTLLGLFSEVFKNKSLWYKMILDEHTLTNER